MPGLDHCGRVHQKLKRWAAARAHVALEIRRNIDDEGEAARIHEPVDVALLDVHRLLEVGRQKAAHDLPRKGGTVLVHDRDRRIADLLAVALRLRHDRKGEGVKHQAQQDVIVQKAPQLLYAQPEDVRERQHFLALPFLLAQEKQTQQQKRRDEQAKPSEPSDQVGEIRILSCTCQRKLERNRSSGKMCPMKAGKPDSEETGTIMPENCVAGRTVRMAVPNSAAICVLVKDEMNIP